MSVNGSSGNIQWQNSTDNLSFFNLPNDTNSVLSISPTITTYYRVRAVNGICTDFSNVVKLKVDSMPGGGVVYPNKIHCTGSNTTIFASGYSGSLNWQLSQDGISFRDTNITSAAFLVSPVNTTFYRIKVERGLCNAAYSNVIKLTTIPGPVGGNIYVVSDTLCEGSSTDLFINGHSGNIQWQEKNEFSSTWSDIFGVNDIKLSPMINENQYFRAKISLGSCPEQITNEVKINAVKAAIAGNISGNTMVMCAEEKVDLKLSGSYGNIQWQESVDSFNWADIPGANGISFNEPPLTDVRNYRAVLSNSFCSDTTLAYQVRVNEDAIPAPSVLNKKICSGVQVVLNLNGTYEEIQWESSVGTLDFKELANEKLNSLMVSPLLTTLYRARITTPNCGVLYSGVDTIEVIDYKGAGNVYQDSIIESILRVKHNDANGDIQWQVSADTLNFKDIIGENSGNLSVQPFSNQYYRVKVTNGQCLAYSNYIRPAFANSVFEISPLPASNVLNIVYDLIHEQQVVLKIYNVLGNNVFEKVYSGVKGYNQVAVDISMFNSGSYYITLDKRTYLVRKKFIKD